MRHKLICALDTGDLSEAKRQVSRLKKYVGAFKIGHGLVLPNGLSVIEELREFGADRVFLDLKFHDIPNSVALAVREAAKHGVWMMTLHLSGGPAMVTAAVEEASIYGEKEAPLLVGVSVLTSLDQKTLNGSLGVNRTIAEHMEVLSEMGCNAGLDGVVCSVEEIERLRKVVGHGVIVTPGIRPKSGDVHDQIRTGDAADAIGLGADYLVIGRALTDREDVEQALADLGLEALEA